jgi:hypothetical protein
MCLIPTFVGDVENILCLWTLKLKDPGFRGVKQFPTSNLKLENPVLKDAVELEIGLPMNFSLEIVRKLLQFNLYTETNCCAF